MVRVTHQPGNVVHVALDPNVRVSEWFAREVEDIFMDYEYLPLNKQTMTDMAAEIRLVLYKEQEQNHDLFEVIE